ncbi:MAG: thermonuclease family protein [Bacteroidota bacterium]
MEEKLYHYKALVVGVYDGDTITAQVDLGFHVQFTEKFRLSGIDTPEVRGGEREQGIISRDALRSKILNQEVFIETEKDKKGKYGRYLATVHLEEDGEWINVNEWLVTEGLGVFHEY